MLGATRLTSIADRTSNKSGLFHVNVPPLVERILRL